jgi:hypothetical protein
VAGGWLVYYEPLSIATDDPSGLPQDALWRGLTLPVAQRLLAVPNIAVNPQGSFLQVPHAIAFSVGLQKASIDMMRTAAHRQVTVDERLELQNVLAYDTVDAAAEEDHDFNTAAWIGATLEQGAWHRIQAELLLPGLPYAAVRHDVELAYTHDVPCMTGSPPACVEIVVHATPVPWALDDLLGKMHVCRHALWCGKPHLWSATYVRVVTDAKSLMPYVPDIRRYWHMTLGDRRNDRESGMQRVVTSFSYPQGASELDHGSEGPPRADQQDGKPRR